VRLGPFSLTLAALFARRRASEADSLPADAALLAPRCGVGQRVWHRHVEYLVQMGLMARVNGPDGRRQLRFCDPLIAGWFLDATTERLPLPSFAQAPTGWTWVQRVLYAYYMRACADGRPHTVTISHIADALCPNGWPTHLRIGPEGAKRTARRRVQCRTLSAARRQLIDRGLLLPRPPEDAPACPIVLARPPYTADDPTASRRAPDGPEPTIQSLVALPPDIWPDDDEA